MSDTRWEKIFELFEQAVELPAAKRAAFLDEVCNGDAELRREVEKLIADDEKAVDFISAPALAHASATLISDLKIDTEGFPDDFLNRRIGVYKLVRELGRGGMGAVYLAERADGEFDQKVAVKLIKRGMDSDFVVKRFRRERQILAALNHPNIARLLDGGTTEEGLPYFVMEYIEGEPLTSYCENKNLDLLTRLRIFLQVCSAVAFAHRNYVLHRDIKPSNILVNKDGIPKLLDFGISKVLNTKANGATQEQTATQMRLMTPEYASPEQARGEQLSPASDVYSLGIVLYQLLTNERPYQFNSRAPHEIARTICETQPKKLNLISDPAIANNEELKDELERIVLKALQKKVSDRYAWAETLATDIEQVLNRQAISTSTSLSGKRTAPTLKSLAALPFKILGSSAQSSTDDIYLGVGLADALTRELSNFRSIAVRPTGSVLKYAQEDPFTAGKQLDVDFIVDGRILKAGSRLRVTAQLISINESAVLWAEQFDETETDLLKLIDSLAAQVSKALGSHLSGEVQNLADHRGTTNEKAYQAYLRGRFYWHSYTAEGLQKAIQYFQEALAHDPDYALAHTGVADYYNLVAIAGAAPRECFPLAKKAALRAIELDPNLAEAYASLGFTTWGYENEHDEARRLFEHALALNPNYVLAHEWYSYVLSSQGEHEIGLTEMKRARELDPQSVTLKAMHAMSLYYARRFEEALTEIRAALSLNPNNYYVLQGFGWICPQVGKFDEGIEKARKAVELSRRKPFSLWAYGLALAGAGKQPEARTIAEELETLSKTRYVSGYTIASIYAALDDLNSAFRWLDRAIIDRDYWLVWMQTEQRFDKLRADARFADFLKRWKAQLVADVNFSEQVTVKNQPTVTGENEEQKTSPSEEIPVKEIVSEPEIKPQRSVFWKIAVAALAVLAGIGLLYLAAWQLGWFSSGKPLADYYPQTLLNRVGNDRYPQISPDGKQIVFSCRFDVQDDICVIALAIDAVPRRLTFNEFDEFYPSWSPDGKQIVFDRATERGREGDIYIMNADGSNQVNLTNAPGYDVRARFSPDGSQILFSSNRFAGSHVNFDVYVMNPDGSNPRKITDSPRFEGDPIWSPDGKRIAYSHMREKGIYEMVVANADGSNPLVISTDISGETPTSWSPDGKWIAFSSRREGGSTNESDIYIMRPDGSDLRRVTRMPAEDREAVWLSDSRRLVFFSNRDGNYDLYITDAFSNNEMRINAP